MRDVRISVVLPLAALFFSDGARAEERLREPTHVEQGAFVVTFERLVGYSFESVGGGIGRVPGHLGMGAILGPRLGFQSVVPGGFTIGGSLGTLALFSRGRVRETMTLLGLRVGWWFQSEVLGVWPRAGLTFLTARSDDVGISYAGELWLTITLGRHAGLLVGPSAELPMQQERKLGLLGLSFTAGLYEAF